MRIGLFGKILLAFWLTLFVMGQGLWFMNQSGVALSDLRTTERIAPPLLTLLAHRVAVSGVSDAQSELRLLPPDLQRRITIAPVAAQAEMPSRNHFRFSREAFAPDGRRYFLVYIAPGGNGFVGIRPSILLAGAAAGLVFSLALAFYLTRPLLLLRQGFNRMARGDLNVQLQDRIGKRGDEIADLARDFDIMAGRLRQLLTARDRLLNDVSHELRSPLTRLQLAIGLARQDPRRTEDSLDRIDREAGKLDAMVHELLALARAESGAMDEVNDYFDPIAVVESVVADAEFEAQVSGRHIRVMMPTVPGNEHPSIRGSAELVRRAIENVVRNGLRFSPAGGTVQVVVEIDPEPLRYRFTIIDEGAGADAAALDNLFDPFVRADPSGVGLGLAIAKRAILAHGGRIGASNREGGGFVVEIEVPAVAHAASPEVDAPPSHVSDAKEL